MPTTMIILGAVFAGVTLLVVAVSMLLRDKSVNQMEDRLKSLTGKSDRGSDGSLSELSAIIAAQRGENSPLGAVHVDTDRASALLADASEQV